MESKGVLNNYEYLYRSHRFDNRDINQFFDEVDAEDVILSAFDFSGARSTIFGYQYWKKMNEKWQVRLSEYRNSGQLEENGSKVVLTIAHLDHIPEHCDPSNLRALCQKCHNQYDAAHRAETRKRTRNEKEKDMPSLWP